MLSENYSDSRFVSPSHENQQESQRVVPERRLSVKSGHVCVKDVRDLRGVIEREKAEIELLITLEDATSPCALKRPLQGFTSRRGAAIRDFRF